MSTELHDAFEALARLADHDPVPDRLAGIARKRRAQRARNVTVGAAAAVLAVGLGSTALAQSSPDGRGAPPVATPAPDPTPRDTLEVSLAVRPAGEERYRVSYRLTGTSLAVRDPSTGDPVQHGGPLLTRVLLDGKEVGGTDGGLVECDPRGEPETYDDAFGPMDVTIPPGDHTLAVAVDYCGPDGRRLTATDRERSYFAGTDEVVDRASVDLDGAGPVEEVVVVDEGTDASLRVTGSVEGTVSLQAAEPVRIVGAQDLDGDGDLEVKVDVRWRSITALVLVTVDEGRPVLVTSPPEGPRRYSGVVDGDFHGTRFIDGSLTTWTGFGDGERVAPVEGGTWVLEGTRLRLVPFDQQMCGSLRVSPQPC